MRSFSIIILALIVAPLFGISREDSLWIHIKSVAEHNEGSKWRAINTSWQVFVKEFDSESGGYSDWRESESGDSIKIFYVAQCAADSDFSNIMAAGTTDARSYTFSGILRKGGYYIRTLIDDSQNPFRWDFAVGGVHNRAQKQTNDIKRYYTMLGISIFIMLFGIFGIGVIIFLKKKKFRSNNNVL